MTWAVIVIAAALVVAATLALCRMAGRQDDQMDAELDGLQSSDGDSHFHATNDYGYTRQTADWSAASSGQVLTHVVVYDACRRVYTAAEFTEHWRLVDVDPFELGRQMQRMRDHRGLWMPSPVWFVQLSGDQS